MKSVVLVVACTLAFGETLPVPNDGRVQEQPPEGDIIIRKEGPINIVFTMDDESHPEIIDPESNGESLAYKLYPKKHVEETMPEELSVPLKEYQKEASDVAAKANERSPVHEEIIDIELDSEDFPQELYPRKHHIDTHTQVLFVPFNEESKDWYDLTSKRHEKSRVQDKVIDAEPDDEWFSYDSYPKDLGEGLPLEDFFARREDSSEEVRDVIPKEAEKGRVHEEIISVSLDRDGLPFLPISEDKDEETRPEGVFVIKEDSSEETLAVAAEDRNGDSLVVPLPEKKGMLRNPSEMPFGKSDASLRGIGLAEDERTEEERLLFMAKKNEREGSFNVKEISQGVHEVPIVVKTPRDYIIPVTLPSVVNYSEQRLVPPIYSPPDMTIMNPQGKKVAISQTTRLSRGFYPEEVYPEEREVRYEEEIFARDFRPVEVEPKEREQKYAVENEDFKSMEVDPKKEPQENDSVQTPLTALRVNEDIIYPIEIDLEESEEESEGKEMRRQFFDHSYSSEDSDGDSYYVVEDDQDPDSFWSMPLGQEFGDSRDLPSDYSLAENLLDRERLKFLSRQIRKEFERSYPSKAFGAMMARLPSRRGSKHSLSRRPWLHPIHF